MRALRISFVMLALSGLLVAAPLASADPPSLQDIEDHVFSGGVPIPLDTGSLICVDPYDGPEVAVMQPCGPQNNVVINVTYDPSQPVPIIVSACEPTLCFSTGNPTGAYSPYLVQKQDELAQLLARAVSWGGLP